MRFALALLLLLVPNAASAAPLLRGLGGEADFGPNRLFYNDDQSSDALDIRAAFPDGLFFFGTRFDALYLNNNGNVTFGGPLSIYTPDPFPIASQPMIAPWWGDVDTNGMGAPARNGVYWSITPGRFVATWHDVGYFASHDDRQNDFQLILTAAGPGVGDFDVEFRYNRCEWTTGDASGGSGGLGGTPAQAGFDAGNLRDFYTLPGSRTADVLRLCSTSNVDIPGVWRFEIRGGEVMCAGRGDPCETGRPGVCAMGVIRCRGEESVCTPPEPTDDTCNGLDDDCDGATDEDLGFEECGLGPCLTSVPRCLDGVPQTCTPLPGSPETCNRIDDDCNGEVDDLPPIRCGIGICEREVPACGAACVPGDPIPETCNGYDDDCDGTADDGLDACFARPDAGPIDAGGPSLDGGYRNPFQLEGRAGPIGCGCRAGTSHGGLWPLALLLLVLLRPRA